MENFAFLNQDKSKTRQLNEIIVNGIRKFDDDFRKTTQNYKPLNGYNIKDSNCESNNVQGYHNSYTYSTNRNHSQNQNKFLENGKFCYTIINLSKKIIVLETTFQILQNININQKNYRVIKLRTCIKIHQLYYRIKIRTMLVNQLGSMLILTYLIHIL